MLVHTDEFTREHSSGIDIRRERLKALIVSKDLRGARRRHWSNQKRVTHSVSLDVLSELIPVIAVSVRLLPPQIELELTLGQRTSFKCFVRPLLFGELHRGFHGSMIDGLENLCI